MNSMNLQRVSPCDLIRTSQVKTKNNHDSPQGHDASAAEPTRRPEPLHEQRRRPAVHASTPEPLDPISIETVHSHDRHGMQLLAHTRNVDGLPEREMASLHDLGHNQVFRQHSEHHEKACQTPVLPPFIILIDIFEEYLKLKKLNSPQNLSIKYI